MEDIPTHLMHARIISRRKELETYKNTIARKLRERAHAELAKHYKQRLEDRYGIRENLETTRTS